jgi:hypothetical protein
VELGLFLGPDLLHRVNPLAQQRHAGLRVGAVVAHLLEVPPGSHADGGPTAGDVVEAGYLLGRGDGVAFDQQEDPGAHHEPLGAHRRRGEGHERIECPVVLPRELAAALGPS